MSAGAPLRDVVVVELGHNVAAPFAGEILGEGDGGTGVPLMRTGISG